MTVGWISSPQFQWTSPRAVAPAEVRAPAPPSHDDLMRAAQCLLAAFRRVREARPREWEVPLSNEGGHSGQTPPRFYGCWGYVGSREANEQPAMMFEGLPVYVEGLSKLCRVLYRCRRLARRLDPTNERDAVFAQLVHRIAKSRWAAGPFTRSYHGFGWHTIAVSYPTELLELLAGWVASAPRLPGQKPGPKPSAKLEAIAARCDRLKAEGLSWKGMVPLVAAEFGKVYKSGSLRKNWTRRKQATKSGTD